MEENKPVRLRRGLRAACSMLALAALALPPGRASADTSPADRALAETLYQQARKLMSEKNFAEACPKLAESQRLDPGTGTLLNLATCHEGVGAYATAWTEFNDAAADSRRDGRADREKYARDRIAAIELLLSRLTVSVAPEAEVPGLELKLDGAVIGTAARDIASPVDAGLHVVIATAPGKKRWIGQIRVGMKAEQVKVVVPALEDAAGAAVAAPAGAAAQTSAAPAGPSAAPPPDSGAAPSRPSPLLGWVVGGVGVAGLAVGGVFGLTAMSHWKDRNDGCPDNRCSRAAVDAGDAAKRDAMISNIGFGVGVVGVGVGTWLLVRARSSDAKPAPAARVQVAPDAAPGFAGVRLGGSW